MKKFFVFSLVVVVMLAMAVYAFAVPSGKAIEFDGKGVGKVVFSGAVHADKGLKCADCHQSGLFKMKKGSDTMSMKDMEAGKYCGACHKKGKWWEFWVSTAFETKDNCDKCHKK